MSTRKYKRSKITKPFSTHEKAQHWHPTLNGNVTPEDIAIRSRKKFWFKCPNCIHYFEKSLDSMANGSWCPYCANKKVCGCENCDYCFKKSFASHPKAKQWHPTKNGDIKPINITKHSGKKRWFKCPNCPHDFEKTISNIKIIRGSKKISFCPYCNGGDRRYKKLCGDKKCNYCFKKSFATHTMAKHWHPTKNGDIKPINITKHSGKKCWFKCPNCPHDFEKRPDDMKNNIECPYCHEIGTTGIETKVCGDKNCNYCFEKSFASHPMAKHWHPTKNGKIKPIDIALGGEIKYCFICPYCKNNYYNSIRLIKKGVWCPCTINKTEHKTFQFLNNNTKKYFIKKIKLHYKPKWSNLRKTQNTFYEFDIYIELINGVKIIIEIDGEQHYRQVSNWSTPLHNQIRDEIKQRLAVKNEHNLIRVNQEDIWQDKNNWENDIIDFINYKYKNNDKIHIYDCAGGERYYKN